MDDLVATKRVLATTITAMSSVPTDKVVSPTYRSQRCRTIHIATSIRRIMSARHTALGLTPLSRRETLTCWAVTPRGCRISIAHATASFEVCSGPRARRGQPLWHIWGKRNTGLFPTRHSPAFTLSHRRLSSSVSSPSRSALASMAAQRRRNLALEAASASSASMPQ